MATCKFQGAPGCLPILFRRLPRQHPVPFGTPAEIRQEIRRLRSEMSSGGGYILAPAKALRSETPTENAVAVVEEFLATSAG